MTRVGILALQGGVAEHARMLTALGADVELVRGAAALRRVDGLVLPGGESSTMDRLLRRFDLAEPLAQRIREGLPTLATCAGMILAAREIVDPAPGQQSLGVLDAVVRRNAFGRQVDSVAEVVSTPWGDAEVAFIRAPQVDAVGEDVRVIARRGGGEGPVIAVQDGALTAVSFHPELTGATVFHVQLLRAARAA